MALTADEVRWVAHTTADVRGLVELYARRNNEIAGGRPYA